LIGEGRLKGMEEATQEEAESRADCGCRSGTAGRCCGSDQGGCLSADDATLVGSCILAQWLHSRRSVKEIVLGDFGSS
jgi:hypothetical protein